MGYDRTRDPAWQFSFRDGLHPCRPAAAAPHRWRQGAAPSARDDHKSVEEHLWGQIAGLREAMAVMAARPAVGVDALPDGAAKPQLRDEAAAPWPDLIESFFHTLTIYDGFEDLSNGLEIGDLVRFKGEIDSWSTRIEGTEDYRQGGNLGRPLSPQRRAQARGRGRRGCSGG